MPDDALVSQPVQPLASGQPSQPTQPSQPSQPAQPTKPALAPEPPSFKDKLSSRKFMVAMFGMLANVLMMWKGSLSANTGMTNLFYWGFGFMFCECIVDGAGALRSKDGGLGGILEKVLPMVSEIKALAESLKKKDGVA